MHGTRAGLLSPISRMSGRSDDLARSVRERRAARTPSAPKVSSRAKSRKVTLRVPLSRLERRARIHEKACADRRGQGVLRAATRHGPAGNAALALCEHAPTPRCASLFFPCCLARRLPLGTFCVPARPCRVARLFDSHEGTILSLQLFSAARSSASRSSRGRMPYISTSISQMMAVGVPRWRHQEGRRIGPAKITPWTVPSRSCSAFQGFAAAIAFHNRVSSSSARSLRLPRADRPRTCS